MVLFSACSTKNDRLFQADKSLDDSEKRTVIETRKYNEEVTYEYNIAPNDRLSIMVYIQSGAGSQQMNSMLASQNVNTSIESQENIGLLVTQNGTVRLPLLDTVSVVGMTQDEAAELLIEKYKRFIRNPYVTVEIINQRVIVIGEVKKPGIIPIVNGTMNLIEVISRSGDMTDLAERTNIKIKRGDIRNPELRIIDLTKVENFYNSSLLLKPNDIVYVQPRKMKGYNKAFAEISPLFNTISSILNPFVQRKTLIGPE
jgi:polysaccharide export outer membrane protein